jgi:hypothetical protein
LTPDPSWDDSWSKAAMKMLKVYAEVIHSAVVQSSFIISGYVGSSSSHICVPFLPFFFLMKIWHIPNPDI